MKKVLSVLMVAVALMMAAPAQAQLIKFGVKGGMNFSELDLSVKTYEGVKEKSTGFFIGPMAEITLPIVGLGVDGAVLFSQRGSEITITLSRPIDPHTLPGTPAQKCQLIRHEVYAMG